MKKNLVTAITMVLIIALAGLSIHDGLALKRLGMENASLKSELRDAKVTLESAKNDFQNDLGRMKKDLGIVENDLFLLVLETAPVNFLKA